MWKSFISIFLIIGLKSFLFAQKREEIKLLDSDRIESSKGISEGAKRFIGNVVFSHKNTKMYCDSAYLFREQNIIHAYSNVYINKADSVHIYGDFLLYNANSDVGKVRNNVRLENDSVRLFTDSLDFNSKTNIVNYFNGGRIINGDNKLKSEKGYYYSDQDLFFFKKNVFGETPDYFIETDTLEYNTNSKTAYFLGPTNIYDQESNMYAENGWYKSNEKQFKFSLNAVYQNKEKILKADSLFFDDSLGYGNAWQNIEIIDTIQNIIMKGNYAYYVKEPESFYITDSALFVQVSDYTDSLFMHADSITSNMDSTGVYRILKAFHKVQMFRDDFQARCDSLVYNSKDSVMEFHVEPIIWSEGSQMTADNVELFIKNKKVDFFKLDQTAFIISQEDSSKYNQIKGKVMFGYVRNNKLSKVDVFGNGQTIYFTKDGEEVVGVNYAESTDLNIYLKNGGVRRINLKKQPEGTMYPLDELEETKLKDFKWLDKLRPKSKIDIFYW